MGGGSWLPRGSPEEHEALVSSISHVCRNAGLSLPEADCEKLEEDYCRVDEILSDQQHGKRLVDKCAAHVEMTAYLRKLASRYKGVEANSIALLYGILELAEGLLKSIPFLQEALEVNALGGREAVQEAARQLASLSVMLHGAAAVHRAVGRDLDGAVVRAQEIVEKPSKADLGMQAAPILGGVAGSALILCLRAIGPVGMLGALVLVGAGAAGGSRAATVLQPHIRNMFLRLQEEVSHVAGQVHSKAAAMDALATDLSSTGQQLVSTLDISLDGSALSSQLLEEGLSETAEALEGVVRKSTSCRYRSSAFLSINPVG